MEVGRLLCSRDPGSFHHIVLPFPGVLLLSAYLKINKQRSAAPVCLPGRGKGERKRKHEEQVTSVYRNDKEVAYITYTCVHCRAKARSCGHVLLSGIGKQPLAGQLLMGKQLEGVIH